MKLKLALMTAALALVAMAAACGNSSLAGDGCATNADCGSGLTCMGTNAFPDGGLTDADKPHICEHACETDADCAGTADHFGDTPVCGQDLRGNQFCVLDVQF